MYSLVRQPFGRRSDSPSDDVTDSPSGGPSKLERKLRQPFRRTLEQPLGQKDRNYDLSMGLHTYGVSYLAGLHRPELVPAGTQAAFRLYETISLGERKARQVK